MTLLSIGVNYKKTALELREQLIFNTEQMPAALSSILDNLAVNEAFLLSTCNRTEIYCNSNSEYKSANQLEQELVTWLQDYKSCIVKTSQIDIYKNHQVVKHLMRVASGIDSMVLGEAQILGQIKKSYNIASTNGCIGKKFDKLLQTTFAVAKHVRNSTELGRNPINISYLAYKNLKNWVEYNNFNKKINILLIGAGETIASILKYLNAPWINKINVVNRTLAKANRLGQYTEKSLDIYALADLPNLLKSADIIISAVNIEQPIINLDLLKNINKKLLILDLGMPRNVSPDITSCHNIKLQTLQELKLEADNNLDKKRRAVVAAQKLIDHHTQKYMDWLQSLKSVATVCDFRKQAEDLCLEVQNKAEKLLLSGETPEIVIQYSLRLLRNKLLHHPTIRIREAFINGNISEVNLLKQIFKII